jgi:hypothetical protein
MSFPEHKISVNELLKLIPSHLLDHLAETTGVDHQVKKLFGKNMFNLLLFGLFCSERLGLRTLEEFYRSPYFKTLFKFGDIKPVKYNSLSARLATMNVDFFEQAFQAVYEECSALYGEANLVSNYKITRVDSTMVCEAANKLQQGMHVGGKKDGKKQAKFTVSLTNMFPSSIEFFFKQEHLNENNTIPKAILNAYDKSSDNVFVFDRGVTSREQYCNLNESNISFVTRLKLNSRIEILGDVTKPENRKHRNLIIKKDLRVYLYKKGSKVECPFRLIKTYSEEKGCDFWFITNLFDDVSCEEIIDMYKHRWDIEVFFRFLKQELNLKHFVSVNENGIKILLYMTLIISMLLLIYKKTNELGYTTAKRRFASELKDIVTTMIIIYAGGNPKLVFPDP